MKFLSAILSIICLFLIFQGNMIIFEKVPVCLFICEAKAVSEEQICSQSSLNGIISVYYDLNGTPYIYIDSYIKKNGVFVKGYYRSLPDKNKLNNWSSKGNTNPFTGKKGYENP